MIKLVIEIDDKTSGEIARHFANHDHALGALRELGSQLRGVKHCIEETERREEQDEARKRDATEILKDLRDQVRRRVSVEASTAVLLRGVVDLLDELAKPGWRGMVDAERVRAVADVLIELAPELLGAVEANVAFGARYRTASSRSANNANLREVGRRM